MSAYPCINVGYHRPISTISEIEPSILVVKDLAERWESATIGRTVPIEVTTPNNRRFPNRAGTMAVKKQMRDMETCSDDRGGY
jgi:hypothetical protein